MSAFPRFTGRKKVVPVTDVNAAKEELNAESVETEMSSGTQTSENLETGKVDVASINDTESSESLDEKDVLREPTVEAVSSRIQSEAVTEQQVDEELIERLKSEAEANYDKYIRAVAELENVKKRAVKERADIIRYAGENLAKDLLDVLDNLGRASAQSPQAGAEEVLKGIKLIADQVTGIFERHSIVAQGAVGETFDPLKHEALASVPTSAHPAGTIMEIYRKAYFFRDKLIRPAQVVVAVAPTEQAGASANEEEKAV